MGSLETVDRASGCDCSSAILAASRTAACSSFSLASSGSRGACSPCSPRVNVAISRTCQSESPTLAPIPLLTHDLPTTPAFAALLLPPTPPHHPYPPPTLPDPLPP